MQSRNQFGPRVVDSFRFLLELPCTAARGLFMRSAGHICGRLITFCNLVRLQGFASNLLLHLFVRGGLPAAKNNKANLLGTQAYAPGKTAVMPLVWLDHSAHLLSARRSGVVNAALESGFCRGGLNEKGHSRCDDTRQTGATIIAGSIPADATLSCRIATKTRFPKESLAVTAAGIFQPQTT